MLKHPILDTLPPRIKREVERALTVLPMPTGQVIFNPGDHCEALILVVSGSVKVQLTGASGNRIVLCRLESNDICTLSISCLMSESRYRGEAIAVGACELIMVPKRLFEQMMAESVEFRAAIMASYARHLQDLMLLVEEIAFRRVDERLEAWLSARADKGTITITHQELATELGTAREVVSRLLKELEKRGLVLLARGQIKWL
jgi:CRP/FNR family transcriptional regulator